MDLNEKILGAMERLADRIESLEQRIEQLLDFQKTSIPLKLVYPLMVAMFLSFAGGIGVKALSQFLGLPSVSAEPLNSRTLERSNSPSGKLREVPLSPRDNQPR